MKRLFRNLNKFLQKLSGDNVRLDEKLFTFCSGSKVSEDHRYHTLILIRNPQKNVPYMKMIIEGDKYQSLRKEIL